jgi:dihydrofolate reductase
MRKLIVFEWVTLDGVYDADSMEKWFNPYHSDKRGETISETIGSGDALLLGRTTYEMLGHFWPQQKNDDMGPASSLNAAHKYVVSTTLTDATWKPATVIDKNVIAEVTRLKQQPGRNIIVLGSGTLVQSLMPTNLVDEFRLLVHPVIMGQGKLFFRDGMTTTALDQSATKPLPNGVQLLTYHPSSAARRAAA